MAFGDRDLPALFRETAVPVSFGAFATRGVLDDVEELAEDELPIGVERGMVSVTYPTAALPGVAVDSTVSVDGVPRVVRHRTRVGDGRLTRLFVE